MWSRLSHRVRGSLQIEALRDALLNSELLGLELQAQLVRYKRLYASIFSDFGRFDASPCCQARRCWC